MPDLRSLPGFLLPAAAQCETFPRGACPSSAVTTVRTSGVLYLTALWLPAGLVVSSLNFLTGSTGCAAPTNWWHGLYDNNRNQLAVSADQLTAVITASVIASLAVAQVAAGAAASFTATYSGIHYLGKMVKAASMPTAFTGVSSLTLGQLPPILTGASDVTQTAPPAFPHTATGLSAISTPDYGYV
jgi:hypothetical protein